MMQMEPSSCNYRPTKEDEESFSGAACLIDECHRWWWGPTWPSVQLRTQRGWVSSTQKGGDGDWSRCSREGEVSSVDRGDGDWRESERWWWFRLRKEQNEERAMMVEVQEEEGKQSKIFGKRMKASRRKKKKLKWKCLLPDWISQALYSHIKYKKINK